MAMATIEDFVATRSSDLASPPVMLTPNTHMDEKHDLYGSEIVKMDTENYKLSLDRERSINRLGS